MTPVAKILKSHGTDGGMLISLLGVRIGEIDLGEPVFVSFDGLPVPFYFDDIQPKGTSKAVVHMTDVRTLEDAEEMVGKTVEADIEFEEEGEEDFTGWTLLCRGEKVGEVTGMEPIPGNLCLYVATGEGEAMIPLHEDFIIAVDPESQALDLDLPEGLF